MNGLPRDISERLTKDFGSRSKEAGRILEAFMAEGLSGAERICRCAVQVAKGDLDRLLDAFSLARNDPRDLIIQAEYENWPENPVQVRDLSKPFT